MKLHYEPHSAQGETACGLRDVPPGGLTGALDAVDCGNCLSSLPWRNDVSQRDYKEQFEKFYGPGGFLDRAGQTTSATATTAPQAHSALEKLVAGELGRIARLARDGAGDDVIRVAARNSAETLMRAADALVRHSVAEDRAATAAGERNGE